MIEANGDDKNGGIFSLDVGFTLLNYPPKDKKPVSYTHLRAHETDSYLVCRLLLEKKKHNLKLYGFNLFTHVITFRNCKLSSTNLLTR